MAIKVLDPGFLTSIQDLGREGWQKIGMVVSGAMDSWAHRIVNLLVGNHESQATLEMTLQGPSLQFEEGNWIAIGGAHFDLRMEDTPLPLWRPIYIKPGSTLTCGSVMTGCRAYLAIAGGWKVPKVLGSRSTYLAGGIGGYQGRALRKGDELSTGSSKSQKWLMNSSYSSSWSVGREMLKVYSRAPLVRVLRSRHFDHFTVESQMRFFHESFQIMPQSNRMGYRLQGAKLQTKQRMDRISEGVVWGTIQVPTDGDPIILMSDRQPTGGYDKIAEVITVDLPILAQMKPGDEVRFVEVSLEEAQRAYREREKQIRMMKTGLREKGVGEGYEEIGSQL